MYVNYIVKKMVPSCFFLIKFLAKSKQMTRKPTPAAPPTIIATVFPVAPVEVEGSEFEEPELEDEDEDEEEEDLLGTPFG
jgi:hypothetical protein